MKLFRKWFSTYFNNLNSLFNAQKVIWLLRVAWNLKITKVSRKGQNTPRIPKFRKWPIIFCLSSDSTHPTLFHAIFVFFWFIFCIWFFFCFSYFSFFLFSIFLNFKMTVQNRVSYIGFIFFSCQSCKENIKFRYFIDMHKNKAPMMDNVYGWTIDISLCQLRT